MISGWLRTRGGAREDEQEERRIGAGLSRRPAPQGTVIRVTGQAGGEAERGAGAFADEGAGDHRWSMIII